MDAMLVFLLLFYWRSFAARRAVILRKHRRLFEAQRQIEFAQRKLKTTTSSDDTSYRCTWILPPH